MKFIENLKLTHPDRIPVVVNDLTNNKKIPDDKRRAQHKFLILKTMQYAHFMAVIRQRVNISPSQALFLQLETGIMLSPNSTMGESYNKYKNEKEVLTLNLRIENTFG